MIDMTRLLIAVGILAVFTLLIGLWNWTHLRVARWRTRGRKWPIEVWNGKVTLLYFSTKDCVVCKFQQVKEVAEVRAAFPEDTLDIRKFDALERADIAKLFGVMNVPTTVVLDAQGGLHAFNANLAKSVELIEQIQGALGACKPIEKKAALRPDVTEKVVIIGSGPAGWTAAIYAARAQLEPLVFEGAGDKFMIPGGQLMWTGEVENFPGWPEGIKGPDLMVKLREQAEHWGTRIIGTDVTHIDVSTRPFKLTASDGSVLTSHTVIVATGARARWLGLENEERLARGGGGVSACATCDGPMPMFRNQVVAVIGGGDTALEEAVQLTHFASRVHVINITPDLTASKVMRERARSNAKIEFHMNTTVTDVLGDDRVESLRVKNVVQNTESTMPVKGMFVAIGHKPNTDFLKGVIELTPQGYVVATKPFRTNTSVDGIFAAGDVMDPYYRQAITSAGTGCMAALDAERWLIAQNVSE
ncbi:MAG TPA: thioredoxin-disulfide reductase [Sulfuricaulis sp.]